MARILISEPEPDLRLLAEQAVLELGYEAVLLEAYTAGTPVDVLLLATSADAVAIAQAHRQSDPALPIVSLGTLDAGADIRRLEPVAHLLKPYTLLDLARALTRAVAIHRQSTRTGKQIPRQRSSASPRMNDDRTARLRADRRLLARYHRDGDRAARAALVERFLPLARQLARRYEGSGEPMDDLVQVASVGLLKAIDRFDVDRTTAFSSFAVPTILGELRRHFRDKGWSVRVPRDLQELALRVEKVTEELALTSARKPTVEEIARHIGVTPERVLEGREAAGAHRALSFERPADDGDDEGGGVSMTFGAEDPGYRNAEDAATVAHLVRGLDHREREMLRLRFVEDLTQTEIGERLGVSQMHVSRLLRNALGQLAEAA